MYITFAKPKPSVTELLDLGKVCVVLSLGKYFCHIMYSNDISIINVN